MFQFSAFRLFREQDRVEIGGISAHGRQSGTTTLFLLLAQGCCLSHVSTYPVCSYITFSIFIAEMDSTVDERSKMNAARVCWHWPVAGFSLGRPHPSHLLPQVRTRV